MGRAEVGAFTMSSLQQLRKRLKSVGQQRLILDWLAAVSRFSVEVGALLLLLFALDFALRLQQASRLVLLAAAAFLLLWRLYVLGRPLWRWAEGVTDIALLLERRHPFANTVVAGLQFEQSHSSFQGSEELAAHVTNEAAGCESELDYKSLVPTAAFRQHAFRATCMLACVVTIAVLFPRHSKAFAARLLLLDAAYPTRTRIVEVLINDELVYFQRAARVVEGTPLFFTVRAGGILPVSGTVRVESVTSEDATTLTITRDDNSNEGGMVTYRAAGPKLKERATVAVELGDAQSDEIRIDLVQRPIVEISIDATPPTYAQQTLTVESAQERYGTYLLGSSIGFRLRCTNGKQLRAVDLEWSNELESGTAPFSPLDSGGVGWQLKSNAGPWQPLTEALLFAVTVVDQDGLSTLQPIEGRIEVRPDQSPIGSLRTEHHFVVPTAEPILRYEASDDFGLSGLVLDVSRERDGVESLMKEIDLLVGGTGLTSTARVVGEAVVGLPGFDLRNGDRVLVRLVATDERGEWPSSSFRSDPVEIEIADEARVLRAILEADATAERLLTDAIEEESILKDGR